MRHLLLILGCGTLAALSACNRSEPAPAASKPAAPEALPVRITHPHRGEIARSISLPGTVLAYQQAQLCAKVSGYLRKINVDTGDQVAEGAILAEIEVPELLADQTRFEAEVQVAQVDYRRVHEAQAKAPDLVVPQTVDNAKARLDIAQANLTRNATLLRFATITAPFSGVITRRRVDPGAFIRAATGGGNGQDAALLALMDFSKVRVQAAVPEPEVPHVTNGLPARIEVEELPGRVFQGSVTRYAHALDEATKTMLTEVELPNPDGALRPGMYVNVALAIERRTGTLLVPIEAVLVEKAKSSVFKLKGDRAVKVTVKPGFNDGTAVEILEGITADDQVLLAGKQPLTDGQPVVVREAK